MRRPGGIAGGSSVQLIQIQAVLVDLIIAIIAMGFYYIVIFVSHLWPLFIESYVVLCC